MSQTTTSHQGEENGEQALRIEMSQTTTNDQGEETNGGQALRNGTTATTGKDIEFKNALLVVAALIMAATYQAVIQPPGGLWQDDKTNEHGIRVTEAGKSILASKHSILFGFFLVVNSLGFYGAFFGIAYVIEELPHKKHMRLAFYPFAFTYSFCMGSLATSTKITTLFYTLIPVLSLLLYRLIVKLVKRFSLA